MQKKLLKKSIILALSMTFGLSVSGTALAADTNPFVDVPANHWSYAAVTQLAKAGVIDGYSDKTFQGNKTITRYEMAQIVAKAMAKEDQADAANKATIEKLAKEYQGELKNLNGRVSKLEQQNGMKFNGDIRLRYQDNWDLRSPVYDGDAQRFQERFRLGVTADLSKDATFTGRISAQSYSREDMPPWMGYTKGTFGFDVAKVTLKNILGGSLEVGRNTLTLGQGMIADAPGGYDAAKLNFGGKEVKGSIAYGDLSAATYYPWNQGVVTHVWSSQPGAIWPDSLASNPAVNVSTLNLTYTPNKVVTLTGAALYSHTSYYPYQVYSLGMKAKLANDFTFTTEAARNNKAVNQKDALELGLMYKGANKNQVGSYGLGATYQKFEANSLDGMLTNMEGMFNSPGKDSAPQLYGAKGMLFTGNYTFTKNGILSVSFAPNMTTISDGTGKQVVGTNYTTPGAAPTLSNATTKTPGTKYDPYISVKAEFSF